MSQATIDQHEATVAEVSAKKISYLERRLAALPKEFQPAFIRKAKASGLFEGYEEHMERLSK